MFFGILTRIDGENQHGKQCSKQSTGEDIRRVVDEKVNTGKGDGGGKQKCGPRLFFMPQENHHSCRKA